MKPTNSVYTGLPVTVFEVMSRLAMDHDSINLGQGFPDVDGPVDMLRLAAEVLMDGPNQYPPMMGLPELRQAIAAANKRFYDLDVDWKTEVLVTSGATEALSDSLQALVEPGDEVILIEPLYDCYLPLALRAGAVVKTVRLTPPNWTLTREALEAAFSDKTKLVLLNNPHNPAAKCFSRDELSLLASLIERFDCYAICDEVYEHLCFDDRTHIPLMTLPNMWDRCVRIGSAGKTFSFTGWKVGYITGCARLLDPIAKAHQFTTFTTPPNLQIAVAAGLAKDDIYYQDLAFGLQEKRDRLASGLDAVGFKLIESEATYFLTVDFTEIANQKGLPLDDVNFCEVITKHAGVTAVPVSAFYGDNAPRNFIRFCFCKRDEVLDAAVEKLMHWVTQAL